MGIEAEACTRLSALCLFLCSWYWLYTSELRVVGESFSDTRISFVYKLTIGCLISIYVDDLEARINK
jgi:hypothetical protein